MSALQDYKPHSPQMLPNVTITGAPRAEALYETCFRQGTLFVLLYDLNLPESKSVTNDIDAVLEDLRAAGITSFEHTPILYEDSDGGWDEVITEASEFVGFYHIGGKTADEAISNYFNKQKAI